MSRKKNEIGWFGLSELEKRVLKLQKTYTYEEARKKLSISRERVRQIHNEARKKLDVILNMKNGIQCLPKMSQNWLYSTGIKTIEEAKKWIVKDLPRYPQIGQKTLFCIIAFLIITHIEKCLFIFLPILFH